MQHTRTNQGGSVLAFIIVGLALTAAVIGGIYFVHQRGEQERSATSTSQGTDKQPTTPTTQKTPATQQPASQPSATKPSQPVATKPQSTTPAQVPATGVTQTHLPATGPADTAIQLLAVGLLIMTSVAYVQSRRQQSTLL